MCQEIFKATNSAHPFKLLIILKNRGFRTFTREDNTVKVGLEALVQFQLHNSTTGELLRLDEVNGEPECDDHYDALINIFMETLIHLYSNARNS
uniref:Uncharacterized protein n=1 Tax=Ditylenchus dipsaci TaxID=166011 RepID=A0A915D7M6_9BILA